MGSSQFFTKDSMFLVFGIVGLLVVFLIIIYSKKSKKFEKETTKRNQVEEESIESVGERSVNERDEKGKLTFMDGEDGFELNDLLKAPAEGLGRGNFGNCYKALLDGGLSVVVKRLNDLKPLSKEEFTKQVQAMADLKHPNLLPLVAYYYSKEEKLVISNFAPNGNVYNRLHRGRGTKDRIAFRWTARLLVARGVARALEYLHLNPNSQSVNVPHGNLKSSNVLLDDDAVLVADYGLGSLISLPIAAQRMAAYKSPEFQNHKRVSKKSDVWSYGCFLLELLTGRISVHTAPPGVDSVDLCTWVHRAVREEWTAEIFDLEISVQRSANYGMLRLLQIAVRCCDKSPEKRPEIAEVVREVENIKAMVDSEDEDNFSLDPSMTDDSMSATPSMVMNED